VIALTTESVTTPSGGSEMAKNCDVRNCRGRVPKEISNSPQTENMCPAHYGYYYKTAAAKLTCSVIECTGRARSSSLCKTHTHTPYDVRADFLPEFKVKKIENLTKILGKIHPKPIKDPLNLRHSNLRCVYCAESTLTSIGSPTPHACAECWTIIQTISPLN
jgi:hypothetical protein